MGCKSASALLALLFLIGTSWGAVSLSKDSIECCSTWQSVVTVTDSAGAPISNCKFYVSVMETRGGIETTLSKNTYFTDSKGTATLSYTPGKPGERLKLSISCGDNRLEKTIPVTGLTDGPSGPNITLPSIETGQLAAVAFILFAAVFILKGRPLLNALKIPMPKGKPSYQKKQAAEEEEMAPRRLILDHERKVAAKLARKHKRKEIRLGHEFLRKL